MRTCRAGGPVRISVLTAGVLLPDRYGRETSSASTGTEWCGQDCREGRCTHRTQASWAQGVPIWRADPGRPNEAILGCSVVGWRMWQAQRRREGSRDSVAVSSVTLPRTWSRTDNKPLRDRQQPPNTRPEASYVRSRPDREPPVGEPGLGAPRRRQAAHTPTWARAPPGQGTICPSSASPTITSPQTTSTLPIGTPGNNRRWLTLCCSTHDPGVVLCTVGDNCNSATQQPTCNSDRHLNMDRIPT